MAACELTGIANPGWMKKQPVCTWNISGKEACVCSSDHYHLPINPPCLPWNIELQVDRDPPCPYDFPSSSKKSRLEVLRVVANTLTHVRLSHSCVECTTSLRSNGAGRLAWGVILELLGALCYVARGGPLPPDRVLLCSSVSFEQQHH